MRRILGLSLPVVLLSVACGVTLQWPPSFGGDFSSNGERIYFTATNESGQRITYSSGPGFGGMMMGGRLNCASCHGEDGRGGTHFMHMDRMQAPDITFASLSVESDEHSEDGHAHQGEGYDLEDFRQAVVLGRHPDGQALDNDMPRWKLSDDDLAALFEYIHTLP